MYGMDGRRLANDELEGMWKEAAWLYQYSNPAFLWRTRRK
jgi:hypothetical protein